jgi:hypothetical protein
LGNWPPADRVEPTSQRRAIFREARERACVLLRDLFGNPFRPVRLDPAWLAWEGGTVVKLAPLIYDQGRYQDLPILADALEEAGCTNADILSHSKSNQEHVRGCWLLDLLLGKT